MKIVIVEDHLMFREVIRKVCVKECLFEVVGETGSGAEAIEILRKHKPEILLVDIGLSDLDGFAVARAALKAVPAIRILILSAHIDDQVLAQSEKLSIHGFVDKNTNTIAALKTALRKVAAGLPYFSPAFKVARKTWCADPDSVEKRLSDTEQDVLGLAALGLNNVEIALRLGISPKTVQTHRSNILRRLDIPGTPKLMAYAIGKGFGPPCFGRGV